MLTPHGTGVQAAVTLLATLFLFLLPQSSVAQELLLHMPLDRTLEHRGSVDGEARLYVKGGEDRPEFVPGHVGEALHFDSKATVAIPFELDHDRFPQVTITAWVRQDLATSGSRTVLSPGSPAGARLGVNGGRLAVKAGRTGVSFDQDMPFGEWVFVAGVIDIENGWARLHQNGDTYLREGIDTASKPPREFKNPDSPDAAKSTYLFLGANNFHNWGATARGVSIDDVRLFAGALSEMQVEEIRALDGGNRPD